MQIFEKVKIDQRVWLTILVVYLLIELLCWGFLGLLAKYKGLRFEPVRLTLSISEKNFINSILDGKDWARIYLEFDKDLGWKPRKNFWVVPDKVYTNFSGTRGPGNYAVNKDPFKKRIAAFGDSFTYCEGVLDTNTWEYFLEKMLPNVEVMNFGVPAYGLDQAYWRYIKEGKAFKPDIVLIGYLSENIFRNVNNYRPFYWQWGNILFPKPVYNLKNDELQLMPNYFRQKNDYRTFLSDPEKHLSAIGKYDFYFNSKYYVGKFDFLPSVRLFKLVRYRFKQQRDGIITGGSYNVDSIAFKITTRIFDKFIEEVKRDGSMPVIVIFPETSDLERYRLEKTKVYQPLLDYFKKKNYQYIDALPLIDFWEPNTDINQIFRVHFSPRANFIISKGIQEYLKLNNYLP
ncbi:MAG: SGNH/GDSL hydrolase family protein [Candidatus Omnitrophica bacterium]|nr:SGNH/GDSL hydrolase family protein [Candidatus Omnitrophota bacterium]